MNPKPRELDSKLASLYNKLANLLTTGERVTVFNGAQPQGTQMDKKQLYLEAIKLDPKLASSYSKLATLLAAGESVTVFNGAEPKAHGWTKTALSRSH